MPIFDALAVPFVLWELDFSASDPAFRVRIESFRFLTAFLVHVRQFSHNFEFISALASAELLHALKIRLNLLFSSSFTPNAAYQTQTLKLKRANAENQHLSTWNY